MAKHSMKENLIMHVHSSLGYPDPEVTATSVYHTPFGRVSVEILLLCWHFHGNNDLTCLIYKVSPLKCM